ncbi:MAG: immune inhibitor A [Chloroflexota bacterium]
MRRGARAIRTGALGLLLLLVLALPFPAAAEHHLSTLERLLATPRPPRDPVALTSRVVGKTLPWTATEPFSGPLQVGRRDTFFVLDQTVNQYKQRPSVLRYVSQYAYWYVQEGVNVADGDLAASAQAFDTLVVPTVHRAFGEEWSPGIDGDTRITIFFGEVPGPAAYFSSWDEYPRSVFRYSNEREMIHVNSSAVRPGTTSFSGTLAHEMQHMVHWHRNPEGETWLDEGFGELASSLANSGDAPGTASFRRRPETQLTSWSQSGSTGVHYQAAFLFSHYLLQRFGDAAVADLLSVPGRPPDSITAYLSRTGHGITFDDLFEDWVVANLLDDPSVGDGRYAHTGIDHQATIGATLAPDGQPTEMSVSQYGAQYVEIQGNGRPAELSFEGSTSVRLVGADALSGASVWWSNRADGMDSTLTRAFDLRGLSTATLRFNLWYDTERDFDYLYVMASTDGGARWQVLHGAKAEDANPAGNAVGPGYSGKSGSGGQGEDAQWISDTVDLTPLVGSEVLIRFEYVTDQGYNAQGALLDDVEVPELGFRDDAESDAGWTAEGFLRSDNVIPQTWSLQLVERLRGGETRVRPLPVDADGRLTERLPSPGGDVERTVLVVSGLAPRTLEPAPFRVTLRPAP